MTRVLAVWPYAPWPSVTGTARRLARLSEELARHCEVALVVTAPGQVVDPAVPVLGQPSSPRSPRQLATGMLNAIRTGEPFFTGFFHRADAREIVARALDAWQPDVVWAHGLAGDTIVRGIVPPRQTVIDLSDAEHERFLRLAGDAKPARAALWRWDARRVRSWAPGRLAEVRAVTVVSAADKNAYAALAPKARFVLVPNGVDPQPQPRPDPGGNRLVFLGDLGYPPNARALGWFVDHVLPRTRSGQTLLAVGRGEAPRSPRVEATGFLADLGQAWRQAVGMVVPVTSGGGTRLKVLDAMGAGVAVVSTAFGVDGIDAAPGVHYIRAESAEDFAAACDLLVADPQLRASVALAGYELVRTRFAWSRCLESALPVLEAQD
jgi:glycosyltransferase involved in cell wall biosynthesis